MPRQQFRVAVSRESSGGLILTYMALKIDAIRKLPPRHDLYRPRSRGNASRDGDDHPALLDASSFVRTVEHTLATAPTQNKNTLTK